MKRFDRLLVLRLILIFSLGFLGIYVFISTSYWLVSLWLLVFTLLGIFDLIRFINKTKNDLHTFLVSIRQNDFSASFKQWSSSGPDAELQSVYTAIMEQFKKLRNEKESNFHFLQAVVEHSGVALIGYRVKDEQITLMNQAAKTLFDKPFMTTIQNFNHIDRQLTSVIKKLQSGEKEMVKVLINNHLLNLSVLAKELKLEDEYYKLVSFQNIKAELDEKELEAWQKLIRVLTHEIKNSAIPISTLTEVINNIIIDSNGQVKDLGKLEKEDLEDVKVGMQTVLKRSKSLVNFVEAYGKLARLPEPKIKTIKVSEFFRDIENLVRNDLRKSNIELKLDIDENIKLKADPEMLEQVLINLIKNAREALGNNENPVITLKAYHEDNQVVIEIEDNGEGIEAEILENIFVPFYTTKKDGSGIGLSLSRQIIRAHGATIAVTSTPGSGTTFILRF